MKPFPCFPPFPPPAPPPLLILGLGQREDERKHAHSHSPPSTLEAGPGPPGHLISGQGRADAGLASRGSWGRSADALGIAKAVRIAPDPRPICLSVCPVLRLGRLLSFQISVPLAGRSLLCLANLTLLLLGVGMLPTAEACLGISRPLPPPRTFYLTPPPLSLKIPP